MAQGAGLDSGAPYKDAYDVLYGEDLVGEWKGVIRGSSISQRDGLMDGKAIFARRGYEGGSTFGLSLHDHRHRQGQTFSQISIGNLPCGPEGRMTRAVHVLETQQFPGEFGTVLFENHLASTGRSDMQIFQIYGASGSMPAVVHTKWTPETFTLRLSGSLISFVTPTRNGTFDYERQREGYKDSLSIDLTFTLKRTPENQSVFDRTICDQTEFDPMHVVETTPEHGRENVLVRGADFLIELDSDLYRESLNETTVLLSTRDQENGYVFVSKEVALEDSRKIRITPLEELLPGTIYEIELISGEDGVRGTDSQVLPADLRLAFSTEVDPERVLVDLYQVSRNASLVHGKPAVARVTTEWQERDDIHPAWQVLSYPIRVEIKDEYEQAIFPERKGRVKRPDLLNKEEIRLGKKTLDVYGWKPSAGNSPTTAIAWVFPDDPYPQDIEPTAKLAEQPMTYAVRHAHQITFDYYLAEHSEWQDKGVEPDMVNAVHIAAMRDRQFANQIFPVAQVVGQFQGSFNLKDTICNVPGVSWVVCEEGFSFWDNPKGAAAQNDFGPFLELMHEQVAARSTADILVSYHPPSVQGGGQAASPFAQPESLSRPGNEPYWFGEPDAPVFENLHADSTERNMVVMTTVTRANQFVPAIVLSPLVTHEFGHIFGLPHTPFAIDNEHRGQLCQQHYKTVAPGIDGMRVALDGGAGWQKSTEDGNAQSPEPLLNLMFACIYETRNKYWIDANQYDWLLENLPAMLDHSRGQYRVSESDRSRLALDWQSLIRPASQSSQATQHSQWLLISGWADGKSASLLPAVGVPGPRPPLSEPVATQDALELRVLDEQGRLLASTHVESGDPLKPAQPFSRTVHVTGMVGSIEIRNSERVLSRRSFIEGLTASRFVSHATGKPYRVGEPLVWHNAHGLDGLAHSLRYSPDGEQWRTLAILLPGEQFTPDPSSLRAGPAPAFELTVSDGVRELVTRLPVQLLLPFGPQAVWPVLVHRSDAESALMQTGQAKVLFNASVNPQSLDAVTLVSEGKTIAHRVLLDTTGTELSVVPVDPQKDRHYTALIGTDLESIDGDRLVARIRIEFTSPGPLKQPEVSAWSPERVAQRAARPVLDQKLLSGQPDSFDDAATPKDISIDSPVKPAKNSALAGASGDGEITLMLSSPVTFDAQILDCIVQDGQLNRMDVQFQIPDGGQISIAVVRKEDETIFVKASHGPAGRGDAAMGWHLSMNDGAVIASGSLEDDSNSTGFRVRGFCPV